MSHEASASRHNLPFRRKSEKRGCFGVRNRARESRVADDRDCSWSFRSHHHHHIIEDQSSTCHLENEIKLSNLDSPVTEIATCCHHRCIARSFPSLENLAILIINNDRDGISDYDDNDEGPSWSGASCQLVLWSSAVGENARIDRQGWERGERLMGSFGFFSYYLS